MYIGLGTMKISKAILALCVILSVNACKTASVRALEESSAQPAWVGNTRDFWQENGFLYFKTVLETDTNLEEAKRMSVSKGRLTLAEQIHTRIKNQFLLITESSELDTKHTIKDVFYEKVDGMILTGTHLEDAYFQKIRVQNGPNTKVIYRYYSLLTISQENYADAVNDAFIQTANELPTQNRQIQAISRKFWDNSIGN